MNEVYQYLKTNPTFYMATVEEDQPRVRPFGAVATYEGKLYLVTNNKKKVYEQMQKNPKIELCTVGSDRTWLRVAATVKWEERQEARQYMLDENPGLKRMYSADDGICEVFYLSEATATFYSFTAEPRTINF